MLNLIGAVTPIINKILDLIPDPNARAEAQTMLTTKIMEIEHEINLEQIKLNSIEAQHKSVFVAGWRPFVGWVGGLGFAYATLINPLMQFIARMVGYEGEFPEIESALLITMLSGLLGMGTLRSYDKLKGVSTERLRPTPKEDTKSSFND